MEYYDVPRWEQCPRCGEKAYEVLSTHGHCVECLYSDAFEDETTPLLRSYDDYYERDAGATD